MAFSWEGNFRKLLLPRSLFSENKKSFDSARDFKLRSEALFLLLTFIEGSPHIYWAAFCSRSAIFVGGAIFCVLAPEPHNLCTPPIKTIDTLIILKPVQDKETTWTSAVRWNSWIISILKLQVRFFHWIWFCFTYIPWWQVLDTWAKRKTRSG